MSLIIYGSDEGGKHLLWLRCQVPRHVHNNRHLERGPISLLHLCPPQSLADLCLQNHSAVRNTNYIGWRAVSFLEITVGFC